MLLLFSLPTQETDSDLKAKKEFIRSIWDGSSLRIEGRLHSLGTEGRQGVLKVLVAGRLSKNTQAQLLTWINSSYIFSMCMDSAYYTKVPRDCVWLSELGLCAHQPTPGSEQKFSGSGLQGMRLVSTVGEYVLGCMLPPGVQGRVESSPKGAWGAVRKGPGCRAATKWLMAPVYQWPYHARSLFFCI